MPQPSSVNVGSNRPLLVVLIVAAVALAWLVWHFTSGPRRVSRAAGECRSRYAEAGTFRDTLAVDATYPTEYALETSSRTGPATCGRLRQENRLR
jgi:peptidoglycan/LPS O-acetylase OafA/YrhL